MVALAGSCWSAPAVNLSVRSLQTHQESAKRQRGLQQEKAQVVPNLQQDKPQRQQKLQHHKIWEKSSTAFKGWLEESMANKDKGPLASNEDYIVVDGQRYVRPYFFEFFANAKMRWDKQNLVDLFTSEFQGRNREYYVAAVETGRLRINGKKVTPDTRLRHGQTTSHYVHRHEPPVSADPVRVLNINDQAVTIYKPAGIPVHPCGQYRKNTVVALLQAEHPELGRLWPVHRLDRLVSGLLIMARSAEAADKFRQEIEANSVKKEYVARVSGLFPEEEVEVNMPIVYDAKEGRSTVEEGGEPLNCPVVAVSENDSIGKASITKYRRRSTDGTHSIVTCQPLTGRTHQIRVHLQYLGYPIANDTLYSVQAPPLRSLSRAPADAAAARASPSNQAAVTASGLDKERPTEVTGPAAKVQKVENAEEAGSSRSKGSHKHEERGPSEGSSNGNWTRERREWPQVEFEIDPLCTQCPNLGPEGYEDEMEGLWLHCIKYSGDGWSYECPLPEWAL